MSEGGRGRPPESEKDNEGAERKGSVTSEKSGGGNGKSPREGVDYLLTIGKGEKGPWKKLWGWEKNVGSDFSLQDPGKKCMQPKDNELLARE